MFHIGMWRERMRNSMSDLAEGRRVTPPPPLEEQDEINDRELAGAIGIPLGDAAARCDHLLTELSGIYGRVGHAPFEWYGAKTTTEAVLRSTCIHATMHIAAYHRENGDADMADEVVEKTTKNLREANAPDYVMGIALYNLACVRAQQGRNDEALELLGDAFVRRPDAKRSAPDDPDLKGLRDDPRFKKLVAS
jgi:tetratricopeptide (TPR) repeat protein